MFAHNGSKRPDFAIEPGPGQESVWDYPRPPRLDRSTELVEVRQGDLTIASSRVALRLCETASPPTYYLPEADVDFTRLEQIAHNSFCEWKGQASYFALANDPAEIPVAWLYADPHPSFAAIDKHISFYPNRCHCFVDGERVMPQPGEFYGGWITSRVVGPFKGEPGTGHW